MSRLALLLALPACLAALPAAAAPECPSSRPSIEVRFQAPPPALDNTLTQPALQALAGPGRHGGHTMGLYVARLNAALRTDFSYVRANEGDCVAVTAVTVELTLTDRWIHIVRDDRPGSCDYRVVLEHERKHQAVDEAVTERHRPLIARAIGDAVAALPVPPPAPPGEDAPRRAVLEAAVNRAFQQSVAALAAERDRRQQDVDTPEEYSRVGAACGSG